MRRPTATSAERGALVVVPRDRSGTLPVWYPERPVSGWSPQAVAESALDYAALNADQPLDRRRLARAAFLSLMAELPGVKRAEIEARLRRESARPLQELERAEGYDEAPF